MLFSIGCAAAPVRPDGEPGIAWKVTAAAQVGQARNRVESRLQDQTGRWKSPLGGARLALDLQTPAGLEVSAEASGSLTNNETETWTHDGATVSKNEMEIRGWETRLLAGYGAEVEDIGRFSLLAGLTWRDVEMERNLSDGDSTRWDAGLPFVTVEGRASMPLVGWKSDPRLSFDTSLSFGWLLEPEAQVEGTAVEGDRGWLLRWRAGFDYELTRSTSLYLGGFVERMDLDGGIEGNAEWPDSRSTAGGFEMAFSFRF